jgi:hypothetical protein
MERHIIGIERWRYVGMGLWRLATGVATWRHEGMEV